MARFLSCFVAVVLVLGVVACSVPAVVQATVGGLRDAGATRTVSLSAADAAAPGARGSVSQAGLTYIKSVVLTLIENKFSTVTLPDLNFDKDSFTGSITDLTCADLKIGAATTQLEAGKGVLLGVSEVAVSCHANWKYRENIWPHIPHGSGTVQVDSTSSSASFFVAFSNDGGKPHVNAAQCNAHVDISYMHFDGGLSGDIFNLFKGLIEDHLSKALDSTLCSKLTGIINTEGNKALSSFSMDIPIPLPAPYNVTAVNFGLVGAPDVQSEYFGIDTVGEVYNVDHPATPPFPPPTLPQYSSAEAAHMVEMFISTYTLETATWVLYGLDLFHFVVTPSILPKGSPVALNTSDFGVIAPGMSKEYPNMGLDLSIAAVQPPTIKATSAGMNASIGVQFEFMPVTPKGPVDAFILNCTVATALQASVDEPRKVIVGKLDYIRCPLGVVSTQVGPVNVGDLQALVDFVIPSLALPAINKLLTTGFPLPRIDNLQFTNAELKFGPGYMLMASDFVWTPVTEADAADE